MKSGREPLEPVVPARQVDRDVPFTAPLRRPRRCLRGVAPARRGRPGYDRPALWRIDDAEFGTLLHSGPPPASPRRHGSTEIREDAWALSSYPFNPLAKATSARERPAPASVGRPLEPARGCG